MVYRGGLGSRFKNIDNYYYDLGGLGMRPFNLWNILATPGKCSISIQNKLQPTEQPEEQIVLTFSEAIEDLKQYVNKKKDERKKRNEKDYEEIENFLLYDID